MGPSTNFKCGGVKRAVAGAFRCLASRASPAHSWAPCVSGSYGGLTVVKMIAALVDFQRCRL